VITHVVLLRPRPDLSGDERAGLADALRSAIVAIPSIRSARVGRRVTFGRGYEQLMTTDYEFVALFDFDDLEGLKAYLDHPAHQLLAARFFQVLDEALMYDFETGDGVKGLEGLR
jgi:hypothetical protein